MKDDNKLFEDDQFRHNGSSLGNNLETDHPEIEWMRATELPHIKIDIHRNQKQKEVEKIHLFQKVFHTILQWICTFH